MSFRLRLIVLSALAVAAAISLVSGTVYVLVHVQLYKEFNRTLRDRSAQAVAFPNTSGFPKPRCYMNVTELAAANLRGYFQRIQIMTSNKIELLTVGLPEGDHIPVTGQERLVAADKADAFFHDTTVLGKRIRVYTTNVPPNCALQVARPLSDVTLPLQRLAVVLSVVSLGGIALAAVLGWAIAGTALRPVRHLTEASEHVAHTRDLSRRIEARGRDELARLAGAFNTMLEALDISLRSQRQLVADASHELRTPLTTVKTNVDVLRRADLPKEERDAILRDVGQQIDELAVLVTDIVDLARGVEPNLEVEEVRLDLLVEQAVERARQLSPRNVFALDLEPCLVRGVPSRLERAVANLLDNACKWSPPDAEIEVVVEGGTVSVRDHGRGIDDEDLPFVFDRFYRAPSARALPGSGLGLAIVRQVAESHGGQVTVERPSDGGALLSIVLPCLDESWRSP
ncbi:MAG: HAMP domain-containing sensor histidine kinase [Gaiellaceae bacterium]